MLKIAPIQNLHLQAWPHWPHAGYGFLVLCTVYNTMYKCECTCTVHCTVLNMLTYCGVCGPASTKGTRCTVILKL